MEKKIPLKITIFSILVWGHTQIIKIFNIFLAMLYTFIKINKYGYKIFYITYIKFSTYYTKFSKH